MLKPIVFDLEWNYGTERSCFDYYGKEQSFYGEIIQIGAVKPDSGESFFVTLRPQRFLQLHPQVAQLTGLSHERREGCSIGEGLERFRAWCGEDCMLLSWNQKDAPVLKQNLLLQGMGEDWPQHFGDIQRLYRLDIGSEKSEPPLSEALERLEISREIPFHHALADARYAAEVLRRFSPELWSEQGKRTPEALEQRGRAWQNLREQRLFLSRLSKDSWCCDPQLKEQHCPHCGETLLPAQLWLNGPDNAYRYSLCRCPSCEGEALLYWAMERDNGLYHFLRGIAVPDKMQKKYWHRKAKKALSRKQ